MLAEGVWIALEPVADLFFLLSAAVAGLARGNSRHACLSIYLGSGLGEHGTKPVQFNPIQSQNPQIAQRWAARIGYICNGHPSLQVGLSVLAPPHGPTGQVKWRSLHFLDLFHI